MRSIQRYIIAGLLSAFLGGIALSLLVKVTADLEENIQSEIAQAIATENLMASIKVQLDTLITITDLVFSSQISYLRDPAYAQVGLVKKSISTFLISNQSPKISLVMGLFMKDLTQLEDLISGRIPIQESMEIHDVIVSSLISNYLQSAELLGSSRNVLGKKRDEVAKNNKIFIQTKNENTTKLKRLDARIILPSERKSNSLVLWGKQSKY